MVIMSASITVIVNFPYKQYPTARQGSEQGGGLMSGLGGVSSFAEQGSESLRPLMNDTVSTIRPVVHEVLQKSTVF